MVGRAGKAPRLGRELSVRGPPRRLVLAGPGYPRNDKQQGTRVELDSKSRRQTRYRWRAWEEGSWGNRLRSGGTKPNPQGGGGGEAAGIGARPEGSEDRGAGTDETAGDGAEETAAFLEREHPCSSRVMVRSLCTL